MFMLDSVRMIDPKYGMGDGVRNPGPASCRSEFLLSAMRPLGLLLLMSSLAVGVRAQQPQSTSGYPDSTQTTTSPDCSDPMLASSAECTGQDQGNANQQLNQMNPQFVPGANHIIGGNRRHVQRGKGRGHAPKQVRSEDRQNLA